MPDGQSQQRERDARSYRPAASRSKTAGIRIPATKPQCRGCRCHTKACRLGHDAGHDSSKRQSWLPAGTGGTVRLYRAARAIQSTGCRRLQDVAGESEYTRSPDPPGDEAVTAAAGIVLCGGRSTRMGVPKATLPFGNETMLQRVVRLLHTVVSPIIVVAARGQELPPLPEGVFVTRDERDQQGPLEGLRDRKSVV